MKRIFGIDFGTTSSAVVGTIIEDGIIKQIKYGVGSGVPFPSIVAISKTTGEILTGLEVKNKHEELSGTHEIIYSIKTHLDKENCKVIAGEEYYAEDIACELFTSLKRTVKERTNEDMTEAVVAIPVGFSARKREKLRIAAVMAGIKITSFVSEPTAAFFSNYDNLKSASTIVVFDWGGGTLDVSVLKNENGNIYEISKSGRNIAGDFIDNKIAKYVHAKILQEKQIETRFDDMPFTLQGKMRVQCERAKINFSENDMSMISVLNYGQYGIVRTALDYKVFSELIAPEIKMAMDCLAEALVQADIGKANVDKVLLVGGSSKLRSLREQMFAEFGDKVFIPENPEWDIGQGASLLALQGGSNFSNQSVGMIISDGSYYEFLGKDTKLKEWKKNFRFAITDSSESAQFVFDGSPDIASMQSRCKTLDVPSYGFLQEKIEVTTEVDENLVFRLTAKSDRKSRNEQMTWEYENLKCYYKLLQ